jgi:hypothetical protein
VDERWNVFGDEFSHMANPCEKYSNEGGYLERLTGLDVLYAEGEGAMESVDWDEEEEEVIHISSLALLKVRSDQFTLIYEHLFSYRC